MDENLGNTAPRIITRISDHKKTVPLHSLRVGTNDGTEFYDET